MICWCFYSNYLKNILAKYFVLTLKILQFTKNNNNIINNISSLKKYQKFINFIKDKLTRHKNINN